MKYVLFSSLLAILTACSSIQPLPTKTSGTITSTTAPATTTSTASSNNHEPTSVDLTIPSEIGTNNGATPQLIPNEETVRLGDRGGDVYNPIEESGSLGASVSRKLKVGLSLGPGLYRTINYVSLLKYLERQNLAPQVITGTGFGAIVAAMYASGMTPEVIEWNFYRYFKEKSKYRPYESEWLEEI
ncbi:MAG: patatin-like phospholipase family protein, partial [Bdellovibrionales bacterium]|nr:patatin-like phospholipase family protein [Bdellovibrionales bacterium]